MAVSSEETTTLDRLDRQLLHALRINGRAPFRQIADVLGSSEQTVARRYRRLREGGVVRVHVLPAPVDQALEWFVRIGIRPGGATQFADALAKRADVSWVSITSGGAEIVCLSRPSSPEQRDALLLERLPRTNYVTSLVAHAILRSFTGTIRERWSAFGDPLSSDQHDALWAGATGFEPRSLDAPLGARDRELLAVLADDGRASYTQVAAITGLSPGAVARRIELLLQSGAAHVDTELAVDLLGFPTVATIWMAVAPSDLDEVGWHIARLPATAYTAALSGPANAVASVVCRDTAELYTYLSDEIGAIPAVRSTEVSPVIRRVKTAGSIMRGSRLPAPG